MLVSTMVKNSVQNIFISKINECRYAAIA